MWIGLFSEFKYKICLQIFRWFNPLERNHLSHTPENSMQCNVLTANGERILFLFWILKCSVYSRHPSDKKHGLIKFPTIIDKLGIVYRPVLLLQYACMYSLIYCRCHNLALQKNFSANLYRHSACVLYCVNKRHEVSFSAFSVWQLTMQIDKLSLDSSKRLCRTTLA